MSNPAFQLIELRTSVSGAFGTAPFGTSPFGGNQWPPFELPRVQLGSDNLKRTIRHGVGDIVHRKHGQVVSARKAADWGVWSVNYKVILEPALDELWVFCQARVFKLLPSGDTGSFVKVYWTDTKFDPQLLGNGKYTLSFTIEEVAS